MVETVSFGSLYYGTKAMTPGIDKYEDQSIYIDDTFPGKEITWVKVNGLFVANRCVCRNISWYQLYEQGLIHGVKVAIDGAVYLCRSLKVGNNPDEPNEWEAILDATSDSDDLWHWSECFFWGQEKDKDYADLRSVRGLYAARYWNRNFYMTQGRNGFRPVLEPLYENPNKSPF